MIVPSTHRELEGLIADNWNGGTDRLLKRCQAFAACNQGWDEILCTWDKGHFSRRVSALAGWVSKSQLQRLRLMQLKAGGYKWWVYRAIECPDHETLDGIVLSAEDEFWLTCFPSNSWNCTCQVYGAHTPAGIRRLGGIPESQFHSVSCKANPDTGLALKIEPCFARPEHPDFIACLEALARGVADPVIEGDQ